MSYRLLEQAVTRGAKALGDSFGAAYRMVAGGAPVVKPSVSYKMKPDEALKILNVDRASLSRAAVAAQYEKFYLQNDPDKGGSFYLRSKIYRAKEALDRELGKGDKPTKP